MGLFTQFLDVQKTMLKLFSELRSVKAIEPKSRTDIEQEKTMSFSTFAVLASLLVGSPNIVGGIGSVEALVDRGPIVDLIVRCQSGTAIISFSKIERRYCTPQLECFRALDESIVRSCGN